MRVLNILRRLIPMRWQRVGKKEALSVVTLLRQPYLFHREELQHAAERPGEFEHLACIGVDYMNAETDIELGYCILAKLVAELLDENCTGIYLPSESSLIPNDKNLYLELQRICSARDSGVTLRG